MKPSKIVCESTVDDRQRVAIPDSVSVTSGMSRYGAHLMQLDVLCQKGHFYDFGGFVMAFGVLNFNNMLSLVRLELLLCDIRFVYAFSERLK